MPEEIKIALSIFYQTKIQPYMKTMLLGALLIIIAYVSIWWLGADNPIEEAVEEVLKDETGEDIDLTPDSKVKPCQPSQSKS